LLETSGILAPSMRIFFMVVVFAVMAAAAAATWILTRAPSAAQSARIAAVLEDTAPEGEPASYAHCASCHLHDGSGRPDGSIPRLAGQRRSVLENKLYRLRAGTMRLPVMDPFARTLAPDEITEIARYLSSMPEPTDALSHGTDEERARAASLYGQHCASCHGANGDGNDGLFASRLCGQYAGYLERRLHEAATRTRGDADALMQDVVAAVPADDLRLIVVWLSGGKGCASP
jgi:cytochrome c553